MKWILKLIFLCLSCRLYSTPIEINDFSDYAVLDRFFKAMIQHSDYGYVLESSKPISVVNIRPIDDPIAPQSPWFQLDVYAREAIEVWKKKRLNSANSVLKATEVFDRKSHAKAVEVLFINIPKLRQEIETHLHFFRYGLGPGVNTDDLVKLIAESPQSLDSILRGDNVLIGIVLGFGSYNSLMHSRAEAIHSALSSADIPPFSRHSDILKKEGPNVLKEHELQMLCLSTGCLPHTINEQPLIQPGIGFSSLEEELEFIRSCKINVSHRILEENPRFVFAAYKNKTNDDLIRELENTQERIKKLLIEPNFLECVLEKIAGEKPVINCEKFGTPLFQVPEKSFEALANVLYQYCCQLDSETVLDFVNAFCRCDPSDINQLTRGAMPGILSGLRQAKKNFQLAEIQFGNWPSTKKLEEITSGYLYFEKNKVGKGKSVKTADQLLVSYVIEDSYGTILSADHNCWISLSHTIPGFAHGVKGMQEGEMRTLYIHPSLAYGIKTTLSPCMTLIAKVHLHQVDSQTTSKLPPLDPIDLKWINDPQLYESIKQSSFTMARTLGSRWGTWLSNSSNIDFPKICLLLKQLINDSENKDIMYDNNHLCNRVFWNLLSESDTRK